MGGKGESSLCFSKGSLCGWQRCPASAGVGCVCSRRDAKNPQCRPHCWSQQDTAKTPARLGEMLGPASALPGQFRANTFLLKHWLKGLLEHISCSY